MGWISFAPPAHNHQCAKPKIPRNVEEGSIWQCDDCGKQCEVKEYDGLFRKYKDWMRHYTSAELLEDFDPNDFLTGIG